MNDLSRRGMDLIRYVFPTRLYGVCLGITVAMAIVLCFVPLFNILGYESAAFFGVVLGFFSTGLTLHAHQRGLLRSPLSLDRVEGQRTPVVSFLVTYARHLALGVLPFGILWLN